MATQTYNPNKFRRCVRKAGESEDGSRRFISKSWTHRDGEWQLSINTTTGEVSCTCPDFEYRRHCCKHIARALAQLQREGN